MGRLFRTAAASSRVLRNDQRNVGCLWPARSRPSSQGLPSGRRPQPGSQPTSGGGRPPGVRSPCGCSSYAARGSAQTLARATASRDRIIKAGVQPPPHPKGQQCQLCFSRPHSRSTASRPRYKPSHRAVSRGMRVPSALIHTLPGEHSPEGQRHLDAWHRKLRSPGAVVACRGLCSPFTTRPVWPETTERMRGSRSRRRSRRYRAPCPWRSGRREPVGSHGRRAGREGPELRRPCGVALPRHRTTGGQRAWAASTGPAERGSRLKPAADRSSSGEDPMSEAQ